MIDHLYPITSQMLTDMKDAGLLLEHDRLEVTKQAEVTFGDGHRLRYGVRIERDRLHVSFMLDEAEVEHGYDGVAVRARLRKALEALSRMPAPSGAAAIRKQAFKGVVWPREPVEIDGETAHRYAVVGVLLTDEPIDGFDVSEVILAGKSSGLAEALEHAEQGTDEHRAGLGDATDVLCSLDGLSNEVVDVERVPGEPWRETVRRWASNRGEDVDEQLAVFDRLVALKRRTPAAIALAMFAQAQWVEDWYLSKREPFELKRDDST